MSLNLILNIYNQLNKQFNMKKTVLLLAFIFGSIAAFSQSKIDLSSVNEDAKEMQVLFKKNMDLAKKNPDITKQTKAEDCWDELNSLTDIIETYKSLHMKAYYGEQNAIPEMIKLVAQIKKYKSYSWGFWCTAAATLLFVDLADFVQKYPIK